MPLKINIWKCVLSIYSWNSVSPIIFRGETSHLARTQNMKTLSLQKMTPPPKTIIVLQRVVACDSWTKSHPTATFGWPIFTWGFSALNQARWQLPTVWPLSELGSILKIPGQHPWCGPQHLIQVRAFRCGIELFFLQGWTHLCPSSLNLLFQLPTIGVEGLATLPEFLTKIFSSPGLTFHSLFLNQQELKFQSFLHSHFVLKGKWSFLMHHTFLWLCLSHIYFMYSGFLIRLLHQNPANHIKV